MTTGTPIGLKFPDGTRDGVTLPFETHTTIQEALTDDAHLQVYFLEDRIIEGANK